jgi:hypothetical protein
VKLSAALAVALAVAVAIGFGGPMLAEAWLAGFLLWTLLGVGAIGVLALGHLLREEWLAPIRPPLEAAARSLPLLALMALPVLWSVETLYPWIPDGSGPDEGIRAAMLQPMGFRLRAAGYLLVWAALGWWLARPGPRPALSAVTLTLLLPTMTLAGFDWVLSRDTAWYPSLQGFSLWVQGLAAALAAAILAGRTHPDSDGLPGLERALLTLGLAVLWLWFSQFIVVWMADLPEESAWYLRRLGDWGWVQLGLALPALLLAIALAAPPDHGRWRMVAVCWLLLVQFGAHLWWVLRPDAPVAQPSPWLDLAVATGLGAAWLLWCLGDRLGMPAGPRGAPSRSLSPSVPARASAPRSRPPATG